MKIKIEWLTVDKLSPYERAQFKTWLLAKYIRQAATSSQAHKTVATWPREVQ